MSQVTEQSVRFQTALASIKLIQASAVLDLTEDDLDRKSGSAGMQRPISYAVFCLKKKKPQYVAPLLRVQVAHRLVILEHIVLVVAGRRRDNPLIPPAQAPTRVY